jgi:hypothetical protein
MFYNAGVVIFYNAVVVTRDRRIGSRLEFPLCSATNEETPLLNRVLRLYSEVRNAERQNVETMTENVDFI